MEQEIQAVEEQERRARDCKVCGEPEYSECRVDVHEERAASDERKRIAAWLRENGNNDPYEREVTCDCGGFNSVTWAPDVDKLADAIEALGGEDP